MFCITILSIRLFSTISQFSVNILFWDQWDFYKTLFQEESYLDTFHYIHAPHRQGPGFVIDRIILEITGWNTIYESFFIGLIYLLSTVFALLLKK